METQGIVQPQLTSDGHIITSSTFGHEPLKPVWNYGFSVEAIAGETTFYDIEISNEILLKTGRYLIYNDECVHENDEIELSVIDKNDALGLFSTYGYEVGVDILEIHKFLKSCRVYQVKSDKFGAETWGAFPVYSGLYLRAAYNSYGDTNIKFGMGFLWFL